MQVIIELPGIKAISRNDTTGHFIHYHTNLTNAEQWMVTYGKHQEHHFTRPIDVLIEAYYDTRGRNKVADSPNIDDKIFTDILNRWKPSRKLGRQERAVWFIEDDNPKYLRNVTKRSYSSDQYKVVITMVEVEE